VGIGRLQGVESVDVSLTRGAADVRLRAGNTVTLAQLRKVVKDGGFSSRDTTVTVIGTLTERDGAPLLETTGLNVVWRLARDPKQPQAYDDAVARVKGKQRGAIEIVGVVPVSRDAKQPDQLVVKSLRSVAP
jgi:hypothetical protein